MHDLLLFQRRLFVIGEIAGGFSARHWYQWVLLASGRAK
jgi:hypothetical protein